MKPKRETVTPARIKNEPVTPAKPGTSKIPFLTAPSQKIQKKKRKLPVPTPQKHCTELERPREFGNWELRGINRLDRLAKQHDIDYSKAKSLADKHIADRKMVTGIDKFPGKKSLTEQVVKRIMQAKLKTKL